MQFYSDNDLQLLGLEDELNKRKWYKNLTMLIISRLNMRRVYITKNDNEEYSSVHYACRNGCCNQKLPGELTGTVSGIHLEFGSMILTESFLRTYHLLWTHLQFGDDFNRKGAYELTAIFDSIWNLDIVSTKISLNYHASLKYLRFGHDLQPRAIPRHLPDSTGMTWNLMTISTD